MWGQGCSRSMIRDWRCVVRRRAVLRRGHRRDVGELMLKWPRSLRLTRLVLVLVLLLLKLLLMQLLVRLLVAEGLPLLEGGLIPLRQLLLLEAKGLVPLEGQLG